MSDKPTPPKEIHLQVEIDDQTAQGVYSNLVMTSHSPTEFTIDFIYVQPQQPKARVRSRVITSPQHMKRLLQAIQDSVQRYEAAFGSIELTNAPPNLPQGPIH